MIETWQPWCASILFLTSNLIDACMRDLVITKMFLLLTMRECPVLLCTVGFTIIEHETSDNSRWVFRRQGCSCFCAGHTFTLNYICVSSQQCPLRIMIPNQKPKPSLELRSIFLSLCRGFCTELGIFSNQPSGAGSPGCW